MDDVFRWKPCGISAFVTPRGSASYNNKKDDDDTVVGSETFRFEERDWILKLGWEVNWNDGKYLL